ncbi:MAG: hypothetical protein M1825_005885 [Sarcosagium campestre]|nr:MAG: hypothetical protein M1825_005885 [Sarcosagium campestre]
MASSPPEYQTWSQQDLINRVIELEGRLKAQTASLSASSLAFKTRAAPSKRSFDPSKYSTRLIALKIAYLGQRYNGFESQPKCFTPLPTIEEELWKALCKSRLISPPHEEGDEETISWQGCDYSKCGRTDRGVSAFGQVIGIRVRSNRPSSRRNELGRRSSESSSVGDDATIGKVVTLPLNEAVPGSESGDINSDDGLEDSKRNFDSIKDELPYPKILNKLLPKDIRVLAWCPNPPDDFSARFACRERQYRYFFTQPAFAPVPGPAGIQRHGSKSGREGWLDIDAMREAASHFLGLHDFRNFCKVDASKQLTSFERRIFHADIKEVQPHEAPLCHLARPEFGARSATPDATKDHSSALTPGYANSPKIYTFEVHGSAFLWHQVRHMVGVLFLVGQGLEPPSVVRDLLDIKSHPRRPKYEMATDAPLVLWNCIFPKDEEGPRQDGLDWAYIGSDDGERSALRSEKYGRGSIVDELWTVWRQRKIDELLAGTLLDMVVGQGKADFSAAANTTEDRGAKPASQKVFDGSDTTRLAGKYVPIMEKECMESVEIINQKYAEKKARALKMDASD